VLRSERRQSVECKKVVRGSMATKSLRNTAVYTVPEKLQRNKQKIYYYTSSIIFTPTGRNKIVILFAL
jgi:hypothetical protein